MNFWLKLSVVLFLVGGWTWLFAGEWGRVQAYRPTAWLRDHRADCGIVLTGGSGRIKEGFDLLSQGQIKKLIISGVHPSATLREIFPQWPYYGGLKESDVILERRSRTTYGNAQQTQPLVEALGCRDAILITSTLHMYRALKTFQSAFPRGFLIQGRAIVAGRAEADFFDVLNEAAKSLFYSFWAYEKVQGPGPESKL